MEQLLSSLPGFRWQDILDIILNAYILFRLYVLFRGTNVLRVLMAVVVLWMVSRSASSMGLIITNWAMQGVITAATFVIIIVFRNEISSVVRTRSLKSFLWGIPKQQVNTPVNIIIDSLKELAEEKIGALIVLPMKQRMESIVRPGVPVNAKLSREMLVSLFWPGTPLHDGAVIIQENRISHAGVILPLSQNKELSSKYGTRHRAALGVTELTDALVIVVSEERGRISLVKNNKIKTVNDPSDIEAFLTPYAGEPASKKGKVKKQTREMILAAAICILCTTGLWYSFSRGMETLATHEVPIEFMNPDPKMNIIAASASNAKLLISGTRPLINSLTREQINIKLSLDGARVGANKLNIASENVLLPPGIRLKQIEPDEVEITLDAMMEKQVPIQPDWIGKLPQGYIMKTVSVSPPIIGVTGGEIALKKVSTIFTEKISLDGMTTPGTVTVGLLMSPATLKTKGNVKRVQVKYVVAPKQVL